MAVGVAARVGDELGRVAPALVPAQDEHDRAAGLRRVGRAVRLAVRRRLRGGGALDHQVHGRAVGGHELHRLHQVGALAHGGLLARDGDGRARPRVARHRVGREPGAAGGRAEQEGGRGGVC